MCCEAPLRLCVEICSGRHEKLLKSSETPKRIHWTQCVLGTRWALPTRATRASRRTLRLCPRGWTCTFSSSSRSRGTWTRAARRYALRWSTWTRRPPAPPRPPPVPPASPCPATCPPVRPSPTHPLSSRQDKTTLWHHSLPSTTASLYCIKQPATPIPLLYSQTRIKETQRAVKKSFFYQ